MKPFFKSLLGEFQSSEHTESTTASRHALKLAACVIFLEMASMDNDLSEVEVQEITSIFKSQYGLTEDEISELMANAEKARDLAVDMYSFTRSINEQCSKKDKLQLMEQIWRIVFADGRLDKHEDHMAHKLAHLLKIEHRDLIEAKLKAKADSQS